MTETIYLAGGCFWGCERYFQLIDGIVHTEVGYANGKTNDPCYEDVCNNSGHAEVVKVEFDPKIISLNEILELYYNIIDPLSINKQGNDIGIQYRTGIYYQDDIQKSIIEDSIASLTKKLSRPVAIEHKKIENYYPAEAYHQSYLIKNINGYCHVDLSKFAYAKNYIPRSKRA